MIGLRFAFRYGRLAFRPLLRRDRGEFGSYLGDIPEVSGLWHPTCDVRLLHRWKIQVRSVKRNQG